VIAAEIELDLELFTGPFDLLLTLVLREDVDLLDLDLAEIVVSYIDVLEARGELDLETATEFIVLIAALLELKSRLMLSAGETDELGDLEPGEAAEELLARMLDARRYRHAADHLAALLDQQRGHHYREAPLPGFIKQITLENAEQVYAASQLGEAIGGLLRTPPQISLAHLRISTVTVPARLAHLRKVLLRGSCSFDDAVAGADRMTVAVTLFALLELYKQGEATWQQAAPFAPITIAAVEQPQRPYLIEGAA